ncbi:hypothetical protein OEZ86_000051 [Tetradesmus obliquus]|nr:hypothetical protein OEZ86_000051 [Tetradesmus obliquus]
MSLHSSMMSPTKQALASVLSPNKAVCSPSRQPFAPCNAPRLSPSACTAKRSLTALQQQHAFSSSSRPAAVAAAAAGSENQPGSSSPAPKRREAEQGTPASAAAAAAALLAGAGVATPGPLTPAVSQPLVLGHQQPGSASRSQQHQHLRPQAPHLAAAGSTPRACSAASGLLRPRASLGGGQQQHHALQQHHGASTTPRAAAADTLAAADQVPSPLAILEFPPELEAQPGLLLQDIAQHSHHQQQQQQQRPAMSGRRVNARYDIPLGFDWLAGAPDHAPGLGEGRLELILGPMFAGKTTALINRVKQVSAPEAGRLAVAVKSSKDERYGCHWVVTHDGRCMRCFTADSLAQFRDQLGPAYHKLAVLAIDEAQFFPDLAEFCAEAVDRDGKHVIVAGLSGDFRRQRFGQLTELMPLADSIRQLTSKCAFCSADALFSLRLVDAAGPQALIGGDEKYRAACRRCYLAHSDTMQ